MKKFILLTVLCCFLIMAEAQKFLDLNNQFIALFNNKAYKEALPIGIKAVSSAKKEYGEVSENYAIACHNVAECYHELNQWRNSTYYYFIAIKAYKKARLVEDCNEVALCSNALGIAYLELKKYDSAVYFLEKSFKYFSDNAIEEYDNALVVMNTLIEIYSSDNKFDRWENVCIKMLPFIEKKEGKLSDNYVSIFSSAIFATRELEKYSSVEKLVKPYLPLLKTVLPKYKKEYGLLCYNLGFSLQQLEKYKDAIGYIKDAEIIYKEVNGKEINLDLAFYNNNLGVCYLREQQYDTAANHFEIAFNYLINDKANYPNLIIIASNLYLAYTNNERENKWKVALEKLLLVIEKNETVKSENYCSYLAEYCLTLRKLSLYTEIEKLSRKLLSIRVQMNGIKSSEYANALDVLSRSLSTINKLDEAKDSLYRSIKIKKLIKPIDTLSLVVTYNMLGDVFAKKGLFNKAYAFFDTSIALLKSAKQENTETYHITKRDFAYTYVEGGQYAEAKKLLLEILNYNIKTKGRDFAGNAEVLITIANAEYQLNELFSSKEHAIEAKKITANHFGENDIMVTCNEVLGLCEHKLGGTETALELLNQALANSSKLFGFVNLRTASIYSNLGFVYLETSQYANSEINFKKSLDIKQIIVGKEHPEYALSLMNLAMVYAMQGGEEKAIQMLSEAMQVYIKKDLAGTSNFMKLLSNLTLIVNQLGSYDEAKKLYLQQLSILDARGDYTSLVRYMILNNLAVCCINGKYYTEAEGYAKLAMQFVEKNQGIKTIEYVKSANNLMLAYKYLNKLENAYTIAKEVLPISIEVTGNESELTSIIYFNLYSLSKKNNEESGSFLFKSINNKLKLFNDNFYTLSEADKLNWWGANELYFNYVFDYASKNSTNSNIIKEVTDIQLQLKGFVLNDATATLKKARNISDKTVTKAFDEWQKCKSLLAKQMSLPINQRFYKTDSLEQLSNYLEKQLNTKTAGLLKVSNANKISWKKIQDNLKANEAAIEYLQYATIQDNIVTDSMQYAAILIRKDSVPKFIHLCTEQQVAWCLLGKNTDQKNVRINRLYRSTIKNKKMDDGFVGDSLYKLIFQPMESYLQGVNIVSLAPTGLLHKIAFHALPVSKDTLLLDKYVMQQYTSISSITERSNGVEKMNTVLLMGNADFDAALTKDDELVTNTKSWTALPGTEDEIKNITILFTNKGGYSVKSFSAKNATEEKFKFYSNQSSHIIHLATHGFFLNNEKKHIQTKAATVTEVENNFSLEQNPLMRSGIVLASANRTWNASKMSTTKEDGVVTAYEIAQLNLSNTKLVVLSACETALGDVKGTEGVFGLQRAFKIAGTKYIIVSLWQVPDTETAELMKIFYSNLIVNNNVRESFYLAQKEMRKRYVPYQWAAFILIE